MSEGISELTAEEHLRWLEDRHEAFNVALEAVIAYGNRELARLRAENKKLTAEIVRLNGELDRRALLAVGGDTQ